MEARFPSTITHRRGLPYSKRVIQWDLLSIYFRSLPILTTGRYVEEVGERFASPLPFPHTAMASQIMLHMISALCANRISSECEIFIDVVRHSCNKACPSYPSSLGHPSDAGFAVGYSDTGLLHDTPTACRPSSSIASCPFHAALVSVNK